MVQNCDAFMYKITHKYTTWVPDIKNFKNKGPDVNFLFDFSKTILDLLESNKKIALACFFLRY